MSSGPPCCLFTSHSLENGAEPHSNKVTWAENIPQSLRAQPKAQEK